jgi:hypothetical protein
MFYCNEISGDVADKFQKMPKNPTKSMLKKGMESIQKAYRSIVFARLFWAKVPPDTLRCPPYEL